MKHNKIVTIERSYSQSDDNEVGRISPVRMKNNPVVMMIPNLQGVNMWSLTDKEPDHVLGVWIPLAKRTRDNRNQRRKKKLELTDLQEPRKIRSQDKPRGGRGRGGGRWERVGATTSVCQVPFTYIIIHCYIHNIWHYIYNIIYADIWYI